MSTKDLKLQNCVLRVNINCACDGCKHKVKKLLQKVDGVYSTNIDVEQGKVTVTGNADPLILIKKLNKSGKHAELWGGSQKGSNNNQNQFKNMNQMENLMKELGNNKSQKGGKDKKAEQQMHQNKGSIKDMKKGNKDDNNKSVKFNLSNQGGFDDYDGSDLDEYDDDGSEFDEYDEDDDDGEDDDDDDYHHNQHHQQPIKGMPVMMMNGQGKSGANTKKGGGGGLLEFMNVKDTSGKTDGKKGKGGKNEGGKNGKSDGKIGKGDKNDGKNGKHKKEGKTKQHGGKSGGGFLGLFKVGGEILGLGKKSGKDKKTSGSKNGGTNNDDFESISFNFDKKGPKMGDSVKKGGGVLDKKGGKKGGGGNNGGKAGKIDGAQMMNIKKNGANDMTGGRNMGMGNNNPMDRMGMGNNPTGHMSNFQMGNFPVVQGHPAGMAAGGGGGYFPAGQANPYLNNQQGSSYMNNQQYMAAMMMMNQQRAAGGGGAGMYNPMYGHPQAAPVGYGQPVPPPAADNMTHFFNDENTDSCSVM